MAQNLTVVVGDSSKSSDAVANAATAAADTAVINFKPKDTNGWRDYKKLKTYLILKEQQSEKVIEQQVKDIARKIGSSSIRLVATSFKIIKAIYL